LGKFQQPQLNLSKSEQLHPSFREIKNISINWKNFRKFQHIKSTFRKWQFWAKWNFFIQNWV